MGVATRVTLPLSPWCWYAAAGFLAGAVNSVAGGGSLLTFPTLLAFGMPPLTANATSSVSLVPGSAGAFWGYRDVMRDTRGLALAMAAPSLAGGVLGAWLALRTGDARFAAMVPWLLLGATALFALQGPISARVVPADDGARTPRAWLALGLFQLAVATYGGFFGAGMGILMLAALGIAGVRDIHRANGLKNLAAVCINGVATVTFAAQGRVKWPVAAAMALGAAAGGVWGARVARRIGRRAVRAVVMSVGTAIAAWMLWRRYVT